jgi:hypothetical protein
MYNYFKRQSFYVEMIHFSFIHAMGVYLVNVE